MKTLYLLRHAKSSWDHPGLSDHKRPLNERGRRAAPAMGAYMKEHGYAPELVISSTSQRTRETWALLSAELGAEPEVEFTDEMYHASAGAILTIVESLGDEYSSVLLLGHNPGMHAAADMLAGSGEDELRETLEYKFPTGALAVFEFPVETWRESHAKMGRLVDFVLPRKL